MKHPTSAFLVLGSLGLLSACAKGRASDVNADRIYATYRTTYFAETQTVENDAVFQFEGSTGTYIELDGSAGVTVLGKTMSAATSLLNTVVYELDGTTATFGLASPPTAVTFAYTDTTGKVFTNEIAFPDAVNLSLAATSPNGQSLTFTPTTAPLGGSEKLRAEYSYTVSSGGSTLSRTGSRSCDGGVCTLRSSEELVDATAGSEITIKVCRNRSSTPSQLSSAGGSAEATFCSLHAKVTLSP